jgi:hypothetical protein
MTTVCFDVPDTFHINMMFLHHSTSVWSNCLNLDDIFLRVFISEMNNRIEGRWVNYDHTDVWIIHLHDNVWNYEQDMLEDSISGCLIPIRVNVDDDVSWAESYSNINTELAFSPKIKKYFCITAELSHDSKPVGKIRNNSFQWLCSDNIWTCYSQIYIEFFISILVIFYYDVSFN